MLTTDPMGSLERPMVSFPQQFPKEARRLRPIQSHEERSKVLAHETAGGAVRAEVDAVVLETFLVSIEADRVVLDPPGEQSVCCLCVGDSRAVEWCRCGRSRRSEGM